jgi:putative inorganic carbon (HCO3(-)) transporter
VYASFPIGFHTIPLGNVPVKVVEVVVLLTTTLVVLHRLGTGSAPLAWAPPMWWALFFVAWALVATPSAVNLVDALKQDIGLAGGFILALATLAACRSMKDVRNVVGVMLAVGTILVLAGFQGVSGLRAQLQGAVAVNRAQGLFPQPNDLGTFAAILLMVSIGMGFGARHRWTRVFAASTALLSLIVLTLSLSRGAWIGTAMSGVVLLYLLPAARRALLMAVPALIVAGVAFAAFLPNTPVQVQVITERLSTFTHPEVQDNPYDARPAIWHEAFHEIGQDPMTGQGPGNFPDASALSGSLSQTVGALHAHDTLLTVAAEIGLPGVALLIGFTLALGLVVRRAARKLPDTADRSLVAGLGAGLFILVGQGLVDFNLRNPVLFMLVWSLAGLVLVAGRHVSPAWRRKL